MATTLRTVSAYQSLLREDDYDLKEAGLKTLLSEVNLHWSDIANDLNEIEKLYRDPKFHNKQLAAILLARIYYNLNDYKEALNYALQSGNYFNIEEQNDFVEVLVNKSIEHYIDGVKSNLIDPNASINLEYKKIVDQMVEKSFRRREFKLALGIALDCVDIKLAKRVIDEMNYHELVEFVLPQLDFLEIEFRKELITEISKKKVLDITTPIQYINLLILLKYNDDFATVSSLIYECVKKGDLEIAYTLALEVSEMNGFNLKVAKAIPIEVGSEQQRKNLIHILEGRFKEEVQGIFLKTFAKTDPHYQTILKAIEIKSSVAHGSALLALSMLQAYTQDHSFLLVTQNLEWAAKCTHWAKFASIASLGLIYRNSRSMEPFKPFLPEANKGIVNHFPNGGALYGLGLVYTGTNDETLLNYLLSTSSHMEHSKNEVVMHGACLGLGLTSFATGNNTVGDRLKEFMNISSSVIGEAAALSIGLVYAGTANDAILSELINFAQETEHEKILRSICLAIGIINFEVPSKDFLKNIEDNPKLKLAVPHYLACAYFKTSNPEAVRKLLHATNDISNEVKRSAVIALGFVMYHDPHLVQLLQMMIYSYNPSIRYGCAIALMIGARENKEVLELLWPLLTDAVDYVRQAAYISVAVLLQVNTVNSEPKLEDFRKMISESIGKKHEQVLAKMGAILATGLLDIGGRNMIVSLTTRSGIAKIDAVIGMLVFSNFWNWFPFINFIGLTITASAYIGVTSELKIPEGFQLRSTCKPSMYDYPANIVKEEKKEEVKKDIKVELSTTNKVKARAHKKKGEKGDEMDVEPSLNHQVSLLNQMSLLPPTITKASSSLLPQLGNHTISLPADEELKEEEKKEQKKEDLYSILKNPHRVAERQRRYLQFVEGRYHPILPERKIGICFLKDSQPGVADTYLESVKAEAPKEIVHSLSEPVANKDAHVENMPESFEFNDDEEKSLRRNEEP